MRRRRGGAGSTRRHAGATPHSPCKRRAPSLLLPHRQQEQQEQQPHQRRRAPAALASSPPASTTRSPSRGRGGGAGRGGAGGGRGGGGGGRFAGSGRAPTTPLSPLAAELREADATPQSSVRALATFIEANFDALLLDPRTSADALWRLAEAASAPASSSSSPTAFTEARALQSALPLLYALAWRHAGLDDGGGKGEGEEAGGGSSPSSSASSSDSEAERQGRRGRWTQQRGRSPSSSGGGGGSGSGSALWSARDFARGLTALAALKYTEPDALAALAEASRPLLRGMRARELGRLAAALGGGGLWLGGGSSGRGGGRCCRPGRRGLAVSSPAAGGAMGAGPPAARPAPGWLAAYMAAAAATLAAGGGGGGGGGAGGSTVGDAVRCLWGLARLGVRPSSAWMGAYWSAVVPALMAFEENPQRDQQQREEQAQALAVLAEALAEARFVAPPRSGSRSTPPLPVSGGVTVSSSSSSASSSSSFVPAAVASALWPRALLDALAARLDALAAPGLLAALLSALARARLAPGAEWLSEFARATLPAAAGFAPWQAVASLDALGQLVAMDREAEAEEGERDGVEEGGEGAEAPRSGLAVALLSAGGADKDGDKKLPAGLGEWLAAALAAVEAQLPQLGARELASLLRGLSLLLLPGGGGGSGGSGSGDAATARRAAARALPLLLREAQEKLRRFGAGDLGGLQASALAVWLASGGGRRGGGDDDGSGNYGGPLSDAWLEAWCTEASTKLPVMNAPELVRVLDALAASDVLLLLGDGGGGGAVDADAGADATTNAAAAAAAGRLTLARDAAQMLSSKRSVLEPGEERAAARALQVLNVGVVVV